jgi:hypothetical protein
MSGLRIAAKCNIVTRPQIGDVVFKPGWADRSLPFVPQVRVTQSEEAGEAAGDRAGEALALASMRKHDRLAIRVQRLPVEVEQGRRLPLKQRARPKACLINWGTSSRRKLSGCDCTVCIARTAPRPAARRESAPHSAARTSARSSTTARPQSRRPAPLPPGRGWVVQGRADRSGTRARRSASESRSARQRQLRRLVLEPREAVHHQRRRGMDCPELLFEFPAVPSGEILDELARLDARQQIVLKRRDIAGRRQLEIRTQRGKAQAQR